MQSECSTSFRLIQGILGQVFFFPQMQGDMLAFEKNRKTDTQWECEFAIAWKGEQYSYV